MLGVGLWSLWPAGAAGCTIGPGCTAQLLPWGLQVSSPCWPGWITTEVGRQPFTVYGLLRTAESLSPIDAPAVATSLLAFIVVYFFVFGAGTFYLLALMIQAARRR
jgi:cytochrome d ubiquinol oxidase subunit I